MCVSWSDLTTDIETEKRKSVMIVAGGALKKSYEGNKQKGKARAELLKACLKRFIWKIFCDIVG